MICRMVKKLGPLFICFAVILTATAVQADEDYKIGKGDIMEIDVWKEPDLSRETFVRVDGKISLKLIGDVQAAGRTPMELAEVIEDKLQEFIEAPEVTVMIKSQVSRQFYAIGEIANTGAYELNKDLTLIQAIALVGGFTEWADQDDVVVLRREGGTDKRIEINVKDIVKGKAPEQNIELQKDDTIIVPY